MACYESSVPIGQIWSLRGHQIRKVLSHPAETFPGELLAEGLVISVGGGGWNQRWGLTGGRMPLGCAGGVYSSA